jgi:hypothetical protein
MQIDLGKAAAYSAQGLAAPWGAECNGLLPPAGTGSNGAFRARHNRKSEVRICEKSSRP